MSTPSQTAKIEGPAWDLESEYPSLESSVFLSDWKTVEDGLKELKALTSRIEMPAAGAPESAWLAQVPLLQEACKCRQKGEVFHANLHRYLSMVLSVESDHAAARKRQSELEVLSARQSEAWNPADLWITVAPEDAIRAYLDDEAIAVETFVVGRRRLLRDYKLSLAEENMVAALQVNGFSAWSKLYDGLAGSIRCTVQTPEGPREVGAAAAQEFTASPIEPVRRSAFTAIEDAWKPHTESCAAILNALAGWRHELNRRRSHTKGMDFLDGPLYSNRIEPATLEAMMDAVAEAGRPVARQALKVMAHALGKDAIDAWDMMAPAPARPGAPPSKLMPFDDAVELIARCAADVDPEMGDFVRMMRDKRWIEGRVGQKKLPGAYCSKFHKSRTPRVYMTYQGTPSNVRTLAHELGHAYHGWIMRDLPMSQTSYPMTLAETASILTETLVNDVVAANQADPVARLGAVWDDAANAVSFLLNIPTRYTFEREFYERRKKGQVSANELTEMSRRHFTEHYGPGMAQVPNAYWQTKLHFYISSLSFYNFPYTFGYLFALGVYAQRENLGKGFAKAYRDLLRDTGRMTAEDAAKKHLGADITKPEFWRASIARVERKVQNLEKTLGPA